VARKVSAAALRRRAKLAGKAPAAKRRSRKSTLEDAFLGQIQNAELPAPEREFRFHPKRRWRFDFAWPDLAIAAEVEGGVWSGGRHVQPAGFEADCEKYGHAFAMGWRVLRVTGRMIKNALGIDLLQQALEPQPA
jgi:hypothetical protein